jgi:hypothetical protein
MVCLWTEAHAAIGRERVAGQPRAAAALGQQEVPQGVRDGPAGPLVHAMQVEEGVYSFRRLAVAARAPRPAHSPPLNHLEPKTQFYRRFASATVQIVTI